MKRITLPLLLATALLGQVANAQTSSTTPIIGYYKFDIPVGTTTWNCAFVTKKDFQGAMTSMAPGSPNSNINQTGATFGTFDSHYVEILSGPNTGLILDIVSNTAASITVEGNLGPAGFNLAGTETYCVRKHAMLSTVFAGGAGIAPIDDTVEIFDDAGGSKLAAWDGTTWVDAVDFVTPVDAIIYPAQGFKISSLAGGQITFGGNEVSYVKSGPTKVPVYSGVVNLVGVLNPLVSTGAGANAADEAMLSQLGFATLSPVDDIITKFTTDGTLVETIYVHDGTNVVDGVDFVTVKNTDTIRNGQAFQISPLSDGIYTQPQLVP